MLRFKQYLLEADASPSQYYGTKIGGMNDGSIFPAVSGEGGGAGVIVMDPSGESSTRYSLGMGFELAPQLTGTVQQFVNQYGDKTDNSAVSKAYSEKIKSKFNLPAQDKVVTWQTMNAAVSNQQAEELNKLLVKYNLKSDTPPHSPEHEEWEEYDRWLEKQLEEWERSNPPPVWTEDMTQEEWDILLEDWLFERGLYTDSQEQWYLKNTGRENLPRPDPKPKPRPRAPTWSPKPWWAGEIPPNNPNWWHWGPDGSDTVMGLNNNVPQLLSQGGPQNKPGSNPGVGLSHQERLTDKINNIKGTNSDTEQPPQKALKNNIRQDTWDGEWYEPFGPPAPIEPPAPRQDPDFYDTPEQEWEKFLNSQGHYDNWRLYWEERFGKPVDPADIERMNSEFKKMMEQLRRDYLRMRNPTHDGRGAAPGKYKAWEEILRRFEQYFAPPEIYA